MSREERSHPPTTTDTVWPYDDEDIIPIDEAALAQNQDFIDAILNAAVDGQVMTGDEFKAWLDQLKEQSRTPR